MASPASLADGLPAFDDGIGDLGSHQTDGADGIVIARNDVIDVVGIAVRVDNGYHGNAEPVRFLHGDLFVARIDDE